MNYKLLWKIATVHLKSRLRQTIISGLGVTFGISMFIAMVGFMTGVNEFTDDLMRSNTSHIRIYKDLEKREDQVIEKVEKYIEDLNIIKNVRPLDQKKNIKNSGQIVSILKNDPRTKAVAQRVGAQVFYNSGSTVINGIVNGIDPIEENKIFNLDDKMLEGEITGLLTTKNAVIVGEKLAKKLNLKKKDIIRVTSNEGIQLNLKIVGIYKTGIAVLDEQGYSSLSTAQKLLRKNSSYITEININLKDFDLSLPVAKEIQNRFNIKAEDYNTANAQIQVGYQIRNIMTYAVAGTLLLVACFGIYNILTMMIYEKMDDIAILKATGYSGNDIKFIFISEAMIIGFAGGLLGLLIGYLMSFGISLVPFETDEYISMDTLPVNFDPFYYFLGIVFAVISTFLAGYIPSMKAGKLDPVEILRGK